MSQTHVYVENILLNTLLTAVWPWKVYAPYLSGGLQCLINSNHLCMETLILVFKHLVLGHDPVHYSAIYLVLINEIHETE